MLSSPVRDIAINSKAHSSPPMRTSAIVGQGEFEAEAHYYPRVLNATIHPLVASFFSLGNDRILARYSHLNPQCDITALKSMLEYDPKYFKWAGNFPILI
jgi:hypothetical protein